MAFSLNLLTLKSEADSLLSTAQRDKRTLDVRKQSMALRTDNALENATEQTAELTETRFALNAANANIASLPDGERKEDEVTKKMELELKLRRLTRTGNKRSPISILENEFDLDILDKQIAGIDAFIAAITTRRADLS